jgi:flavodoxin
MKKTLLVFYSRSGYTRQAAQAIAGMLDCDVEEIQDATSRKGWLGYLRSGYDALKNKSAAIKPAKKNPADYELVVLGSPVWASHVPSPLRTYIDAQKNNFKRIACFCTMVGSGAQIVFKEMADLCGKQPLMSLALTDKQIDEQHLAEKITRFAKPLLR